MRPTVGNHPSLHREDVLEQDREEEDRDRDPDQGHDEARVVDRGSVVLRRDEAERDPEQRREDHRGDRELDRRREALLELVDDRPPRGDARAQVALGRGLDVLPVLDVDRLVEPVLLADLCDRLRRRALAEERLRRPARKRPDPDEDEDREPEQDRDQEQQPADDESEHLRRPPADVQVSSLLSIETIENGSSDTGLGT